MLNEKPSESAVNTSAEVVTTKQDASVVSTLNKKRLALPPVKEVSLSWEALKVTTKAGRVLLNGIDGATCPGQVVALMGASGAGKTTLLNTLLQRNLKGLKIEGDILLEGRPIKKGSIGSVSAYVQQEDLFIGTLTVKEHLMIQANLRLHRKMAAEERTARVTAVIHELGLENSQNSRIGAGGVKKGISGGEAKRLAFAAEILANPALLFCDEPTTGLDAFMALQVVKCLCKLAAAGRNIILTVHQPSSEVFEMFDKVLFLALGRVAFFGAPAESLLFFNSCNVLIPEHYNPADILIQNLAVIPHKEDECKERIQIICDAFLSSEYSKNVDKWREFCRKRANEVISGRGRVPIFRRFATLFKRSFLDNLRNPSLFRAKLVQKVFMGLFLGALYFQTKDDQGGVTSLKGALFYYISELTYATTFGIQTFMPADFHLVVREHHDGIYPMALYYVAKVLSYLPIFTIDGILMVCISYFMIGLEADALVFLRTLVTCILIEWSAASIGLMVSAVSPSYAVAVSLSGPMLTVFSLTGGLYTNVAKIPSYVRWIQYLSWFRFGYETLVVNQFVHKEELICDNTTVGHCEATGQEVIDNFNFKNENLYWNWLYMLVYVLIVYIIGYNGILVRAKMAR